MVFDQQKTNMIIAKEIIDYLEWKPLYLDLIIDFNRKYIFLGSVVIATPTNYDSGKNAMLRLS